MAEISGGAVRVTARIAPAGAIVRDFGRTLYLGQFTGVAADAIEATQIRSARSYANATDLAAADWPDAIESAGDIYFQQDPFPRNLAVGVQIRTAQPGAVYGRPVAPSGDAIKGLGATADFTFAGGAFQIDLSSTETLTAAAGALATGINTLAAFSGATVTVSNGALVVTTAVDDSPGVGFAATAGAELLGLSGTGVTVVDNVPVAETVTQALDRIADTGVDFFYVVPAPEIAEVEADIMALANWAAARGYSVFFDIFGAAVLTPDDTMSVGAAVSALEQDGVAGIYSATRDYKALSFAARFSSINYAAPGSLITGKFKQLPGTRPDNLTQTQRDELFRKRINYYLPVGDGADTHEGTSFGTWIDAYSWLAWFSHALETETYTALKGANKIPQTDGGIAILRDAMIAVCEQGVVNGGIAPNQVSPAMAEDIRRTTGNLGFDGSLSLGYLVYVSPLATQLQADRNARKSPPAKLWVKASGAIHSLEITVEFEN